MLVAELSFALSGAAFNEAVEAVTWLFAAWYKNGQIEKEWQLIESNGQLVAYALLPEADSLDSRNDNVYVTRFMGQLASRGVERPIVVIRGASPDFDPSCGCPVRESLILFTNIYSRTSPVRCGTCFMPVPLYRLPHTHDFEHLNILHWAADYRACDTLQMHCTTGERFAEAQLFRHDSSLSRNGRAVATKLAAATGLPVYYFLFKARGRSRAHELRRRCPECGDAWLLPERWHNNFDFRCVRCGLLSNVACSLAA